LGQHRTYASLFSTSCSAGQNALDLGFGDHIVPAVQVTGHKRFEIIRISGRWFASNRANARRHRRIGDMCSYLDQAARQPPAENVNAKEAPLL
jgi:hypothetical protein